MSDRFTIGERDLLLVVDVQNDFCPGGGWPRNSRMWC
jgi:nicotinamidase-related amidase